MPTAEKEAVIDEIREKIQGSEVAIISTYIGINADEVTSLRRQMRENGIDYKVYKNNLARRALRELGLEDAANAMDGPTAWAFSSDPVAPAKLLKDLSKSIDEISMRGGVLGDKIVDGAQLEALAALPDREVLLAQVVGTIAAPLRQFVGTLNALPRNLVNVLDQIKQKKEEEGGSGAEA